MELTDAVALTEAVEQQQVKSVTLESIHTENTASATPGAIKKTPLAANVKHTATGSKARPEHALNAAACCSPSGSPKHHNEHGRSHKRKQKHSKAAASNSGSDHSDTDSGPLVRKQHGGIKAWRYPGLQSTSSYRQLTTVGSCHQYTIRGYTLAKALGPGTCLRSDVFEAGGQKFKVEVFPAGLSADTANHLSLFLTTPGSINPNHVLYELAVVDQSGRGRHLIRASKPNRQGPSNSLHTGVIAGYPSFVRTALLQQHQLRYLQSDCLIIRATVEVVRTWSAAPQQLALPGSIYSPTRMQQQLPQQQDGFLAPCYSPQPDYQDQLVTCYQQQQVVANQGRQLQQVFSSQPCMCPACCLGNTAGGNTAAAGLAALAPSSPSLPYQQLAQPCSCPVCAAAATAACGGVNKQLGSPMQQQPMEVSAVAAGECSCAACSVQKLVQLLPALVQLQLAAGSERSAAQPQQVSTAYGTAAPAAAAAGFAQDNSKNSATARQPTAPGDAGAEQKPLFRDAAALGGVGGQQAELQQQLMQQQQQVKHQHSCWTCTTNSIGVSPATADNPVCNKLANCASMQQQQQQQRAGVCPPGGLSAGQSPSNLGSRCCSCELGNPCSYFNMLAGNQSSLLQGQHQQCFIRQHPPTPHFLQHWPPQQQHQRASAPALCEVRGVDSSHVPCGEPDALQQVDTAGLAVPLVMHHPTRIVYM